MTNQNPPGGNRSSTPSKNNKKPFYSKQGNKQQRPNHNNTGNSGTNHSSAKAPTSPNNQTNKTSSDHKNPSHLRREKPSQNNAQKNGQQKSQSGHFNKNSKNRHSRPYQNKKIGSSRTESLTSIFQKFDSLITNIQQARFKLYEMFYRAQGPQLQKIKEQYSLALQNLQQFKSQLSDYQKTKLDQRYPSKLDVTYSSNHQLVVDASLENNLEELRPQDPHILPQQKQRPSFQSDTEESKGSMEDYYKLKGLTPPQNTQRS